MDNTVIVVTQKRYQSKKYFRVANGLLNKVQAKVNLSIFISLYFLAL